MAREGRALFPADRAPQERPRRPRPGLPVLARPGSAGTTSTATRRSIERRDRGRPHAGPALQGEGPLPALVRRRREPVHRHHDERRRSSSTPRRQTGDADLLRDRHPALPDHPPLPRARRRQHAPTKASSTPRPASSCARARTRAGATIPSGRAAWPGRCTASARSTASHATTRVSCRPPRRCADFYIERTPAHGVPPNDWDEPDPALPVRELGRRHRRQRAAQPGQADRRPGPTAAATATTPCASSTR